VIILLTAKVPAHEQWRGRLLVRPAMIKACVLTPYQCGVNRLGATGKNEGVNEVWKGTKELMQ
jgi:hypothetical protein